MTRKRQSATTSSSPIEEMCPAGAKLPFDPEAAAHLQARCRRDVKSGCLLFLKWQRDNGYGGLNYRGRQWHAHRLSYYAQYGAIPKGYYVCHRCDNRLCVAVEHLFLGTPQENVTDMVRKGRGRWKSLLRKEEVVEIKRRLASGHTCAEVAKTMSFPYATIFSIKSGRNWRHVPSPVAANVPQTGQPGPDRIPVIRFAAWYGPP